MEKVVHVDKVQRRRERVVALRPFLTHVGGRADFLHTPPKSQSTPVRTTLWQLINSVFAIN